MSEWPVVVLFAFLTFGACARGTMLYLIGRGARGVAERRWELKADWIRRGEVIVRRFGAPAVTLCFLTVGLQSAVLISAGTLRMPPRRFVPALLVGALLWAGIYTTIGFAVVEAIWGDGRLWLVIAVLLLAGLLVWGSRRVLTRRRA